MKKAISLVLSLALMASSASSVLAQPTKQSMEKTSSAYVEGEAIVCVSGEVNSLNAMNRSRGLEITPLMKLPEDKEASPSAYRNGVNLQQKETLALVKSDQDTESLIRELEKIPTVEFAEPNYKVKLYDVPEDPYYEYQWGLENQMGTEKAVDANIAKAWENSSSTSETPVVAVLDSGVDYKHPDLKNVMWDDGLKYPELTAMGGGIYGFNTCDGPEKTNDPMDTIVGHGTHCAGIIAAQWNNEEGGAGVSSEAEIMAVKFLGGSDGSIADSLKGYAYIQAAKESGVNVVAINNSWGPSEYNGVQLHSVSKATEALGELGVISCFAAGNDDVNNDLNTGSIVSSPYVITVGALESQGHRAPFSCYGQRTVDVFAPGAQILAPTTSDTSVAAPNEHQMPPQYLPQIMQKDQSYFYEDFEDGSSSVTLRVLDADGTVIEDNQTPLTPGYMGGKGTQISLDAVEDGETFYVEMTFQKSDFVALDSVDENSAVYFAFQAGMGSSCLQQSMPILYQDKDGNWQRLLSTQLVSGENFPARLRMMDYNWNQSTQELNDNSFLQNEGETITLRLEAKMTDKQPGVAFHMDDVGFGKEAVPYYYADGTSMATPMVTGIMALLSTQYDDAAEICARIKGSVNREEAIGLEDICVSGGFVDAAASFDDSQLAPVVNSLDTDGTTATVTGYFFGKEQGSVQVGGQQAAVNSWSDNVVTFTVPEGVSGLEEIQVTAKDGQYGRNFFEITAATQGYKKLSTPNFSYGDIYGYELTSADILPITMAAAGGKILIMGVLLESNQLVMELYDIKSDTWSQAPLLDDLEIFGDLNYPLYSMAGGLSKIYLHYITTTGQQKLGIYDTVSGTWSSVDTKLTGITEALVVYQNQLLAIGGEILNDDMSLKETLRSVQILDPSTGEVIGSLPDLPEGRSRTQAFASGDTLVVYGGYDSVFLKMLGQETNEYCNTMVYDGKEWVNYEEDQFLSDQNSEFDPMQTLEYAIGAVDGGVIVTGPVQGLGSDSMVDTWNFDASTGSWSGNQDILYSQIKTTRNIGVTYDGQFYVMGYTGAYNKLKIFRSTPVSYTGPTQDPSFGQSEITIPVIYRYEENIVAQEEAVLSEGDNIVAADEDFAEKYGFALKDSEQDKRTVRVTRNLETGELEADVDAINFDVVPTVDPAEKFFHVSYIDGEGNPVPGGGEIAFDKVGPYSREDIPLPYGYMEVIPAHPDEDWLYPTSLEWEDGQWIVTNPVVEIMVEKMASVEIIFKDTDGNILEELGYTKYYDSEGGGIETVTAPEGYEFVGENTYAVEVSRDADGHLVADPAEVVFVVKAVGTGEPTDPGEPADPENPSTPDNTDPDSPKTGDSSNYLFWSMILLASGGILATLIVCRRKQRKI